MDGWMDLIERMILTNDITIIQIQKLHLETIHHRRRRRRHYSRRILLADYVKLPRYRIIL
jgi:HSP20 family molecular chaperone IbpA